MRRLTLTLVFLLMASSAHAIDYYMSDGTHGEMSAANTNSCMQARTITTPKRWLTSDGNPGALSCLGSGDTLYIRGGTYNDLKPRATVASGGGSFATATRIRNYASEVVWLKPDFCNASNPHMNFGGTESYIEVTGINLDGALCDDTFVSVEDGYSGSHAHHIRIQDAEFKGAPLGSGHMTSHGILTRGFDGSTIGRNEFIRLVIHDIGEDGYVHGMYLTTPNDLVDGVDFYNIAGAGIQVQSGPENPRTIIRNSKFHNPRPFQYDSGIGGHNGTHWGIVMSYTGVVGGTTAVIYNNTFYNYTTGEGEGNYAVHFFNVGDGSEVYNNTCYNAATHCYLIASGTNTAFRNNIAYAAGTNYQDSTTGTKSNNLTNGTNPGFVNAGTGDFRLASTSSAAYNTGTPLSTTTINGTSISTDKAGVARPQAGTWDIGAYELATGALPVGAPINLVPVTWATGVAFAPLNMSWAFDPNGATPTSYDVYLGTYNGVGSASFADPFTGTGTIGANWDTSFTITANPWARISDVLRPTAGGSLDNLAIATDTLGNNHWVEFTISTYNTAPGSLNVNAVLRSDSATWSGYFVGARSDGTNTSRIMRCNATVDTCLNLVLDNSVTWAAGNVLRATIVDNVISLYRNGTLVISYTDTDTTNRIMTGSKAGAYGWTAGATTDLGIDLYSQGTMGPVLVSNQAGTTYSTTAASITAYIYRVVAKTALDFASSPTLTFTTLGGAVPACPSNMSPVTGATAVSTTVMPAWDAVSSATGYDVYFGTSATPPLAVFNQTALSYTPGVLTAGVQHFWKVVPKNTNGDASSCLTLNFTTAAAGGGGHRLRLGR